MPCFNFCLIKKTAPFELYGFTLLITAETALVYVLAQLLLGPLTSGALFALLDVLLLLSIRRKYGLMDDSDCMFVTKALFCSCCTSIQIYDSVDQLEGANEQSGLLEGNAAKQENAAENV